MDEPMHDAIHVGSFLAECQRHFTEFDFGLTDDYVACKGPTYPVEFDTSRFDPKSLGPNPDGGSGDGGGGYTKELLEKVEDTKGLQVLEQRKIHLSIPRDPSRRTRLFRSDGPEIHRLLDRIGSADDGDGDAGLSRPEVLLKIHFYKSAKVVSNVGVRSTEYDVLGRTTLTSFRDAVECLSDAVHLCEYTLNPDGKPGRTARDVYASGFFFVEGTFYVDSRHEGSIDLTEPIRLWAEERSDKVGPFERREMAGLTFADLVIKIGRPYLYVHQGDCEHLFQFTDLRTVTEADCRRPDEYPMRLTHVKGRHLPCAACDTRLAKWFVRNGELVPDDPCYLCHLCLKMFLYDEEGKPIDPGARVYAYPGQYELDEFNQ